MRRWHGALPDGPWSRRTPYPQLPYPALQRRGYPLAFENRDGRLVLKLTFAQLNQEDQWISDDDDLRIVARRPVAESVTARWSAAAKGTDLIARGEIVLPVIHPSTSTEDGVQA